MIDSSTPILTVLAVATGLLIAVGGIVVGVVVRQLVRRRAVDVPDGPRPHVTEEDTDVTLCTVCGTLNESGFRRCRHCNWLLDDAGH